ncbi:MAG: hypothetical protein QXG86_02440 [Candidatus Woesearchaeota archaeon]
MKRGRPVKSIIRQNIVDILYFLGEGYGYDIYKIYLSVFPKCAQKSIYYHLKKGVETGEFIVKKIEKEKGNFSWGSEVEKTYYALGPKASPRAEQRVKEEVEKYVQLCKRSRQSN